MNKKAAQKSKEKNTINRQTGRKPCQPKLFIIIVIDADGNKRIMLSTKNSGTIQVNSSRSMHSAWTKQQTIIKDNKVADKLNSFFG